MKYRYFITGRSGTREVKPLNDGSLEKNYDKKSKRSSFTSTMKGSIVLIGEDFKWLYTQELLVYRFDPLTIKIYKFCNGKWNEDWFEGQISLNSGEWNLDNCRVELTIETADNYACYELGKDTVINLLNTVYPKVEMNPVVGTIETKSFQGNESESETWIEFPGEPNPESKGWSKIAYRYTSYDNDDGGMITRGPARRSGYHEVTWAREVIYDIGDELETQGWISIGRDNYVRALLLYNFKNIPYNQYRPNDHGFTYEILQKPIDNGILLKQIFEQFLVSICSSLTLVSDFFQWNPENPSNINYVTQTLNKYLKLIVFQKSDVKDPYSTGNAGYNPDAKSSEIKFSDLLEDICNIFQLEWEITDDKKFKIEHVSYKSRHQGLNTTSGENGILNKGKRKYSYDNDGIPKKEVFAFMDDNSYGDFKAASIIYTNSIAGKEIDEENYIVKNFTTDVMLCLANPSSDSKVVSKDGFVLMACSPSMSVFRDKSIRGGNTVNNPLAWSQLHRDFWRHNRFMLNFKMNERDTLALSVKPIKVQENVMFRMCCDSDFDTEGLIKTAIGDNGILKSASFNLFKEIIELKIAFPAEGKLEDNLPPNAIDDIAETFQNTPVIVDVLANDIDTDGVIIPSLLKITSVYPGNAIITDDFKVKYTPEIGFIGSGSVWYNVKDNFGEISNNAKVTINVKPGTSLPVANGNSFIIAKNMQLRPGAGSIQKNDTAATSIIVIPESKSSAQGGTVVIESNGNFTYMPADNFVGEDTFNYIIRDNYLNEATGTITITVFDSKTIYVSMHQEDDRDEFTKECQNGMLANGRETNSDITIKLWADSSKTTPFIDAMGYNLVIRVLQKRTDYNNSSGSYEFIRNIDFKEGNEYVLFSGFTTQRNFSGCSSYERENWKIEINLESDPSYIII